MHTGFFLVLDVSVGFVLHKGEGGVINARVPNKFWGIFPFVKWPNIRQIWPKLGRSMEQWTEGGYKFWNENIVQKFREESCGSSNRKILSLFGLGQTELFAYFLLFKQNLFWNAFS